MTGDPLGWLLILGLVLKVLGFAMRDELRLRGLVAAGLSCDLGAAAVYAEPTLEPGLGSLVLLAVNVVVLAILLRERTTLGMPDRDRRLFQAFRTLTPGQFRRINRLGDWSYSDTDRTLLKEGEASDKLIWIDADRFGLEKAGTKSAIEGPGFVGEVSFLHGGTASATITVSAGTIYAAFDRAALRRVMENDRALENALIARFSYDLARRVAASVPAGPTA